jgi:hypothetical protein
MAQAVFVLMVGKDSIVNFVGVKLGMDCILNDLKRCEAYCLYNSKIKCVVSCRQQIG